ncbi:MAG TPA: prolipoprotein diacylglyceryl transferase family protein [Acidimicrobiales bacterium]|nr:prolipoprotein diacylglyceryl transferase family protein [Acidimicrobiales bacterium]
MRALLASFTYDPIVHIPIGPLEISPHGVGIALGFLAGSRLMLPAARVRGIDEDAVYRIVVRAAIGALVGSRLAYVVNHAGDYLDDPLSVLKVWEGGISLLGGIFGAILLCLPLARGLRISAWKGLDAAAPALALGIIVGRIGDLVVGDHLGKPTRFFLGYECPPPSVDTASPCLGNVVHQTALYDLLLTTGLLGLLLVLRRRPRFDGFLIVVFGLWYGLARLVEDFLREDVRRLGLTASQWTAATTATVCLAWLLFVRRTPRWGRWDERDGDGGPGEAGGDAGGEAGATGEEAAAGGGDTPEVPPTMAAQPQNREDS